jgi:hypothetical protein
MTYWDWVGHDRLERARRMYDEDPEHYIVRVTRRTGIWIVRSQRFPRTLFYRVDPKKWTCTCLDFQKHSPLTIRFLCKHLYLVDLIRRGGRRQLRPRRLLSSGQISAPAEHTLSDTNMPGTRLTLGAPAKDPRKLNPRARALDYARGIARRDQDTPIEPDPTFDPFLFSIAR